MKKLIILAFFAAGLQWVAAQNTRFYYDLNNPHGMGINRGIIRDNNIVYYEDSGNGYFAYIPSFVIPAMVTPTLYNRVQIPEKWTVKDFRVVGGIAYFCGRDNNSERALLGHFDISDLFSFPGQVVFYRDVNIVGPLDVLNRIAVKTDKTTVSVMAIGNDIQPGDPEGISSNKVLYIDDYAATTGCIFSSSDSEELFWDVVSTENCFTVAGTHMQVPNMLTMRRVMFGTPVAAFLATFSNSYNIPIHMILQEVYGLQI